MAQPKPFTLLSQPNIDQEEEEIQVSEIDVALPVTEDKLNLENTEGENTSECLSPFDPYPGHPSRKILYVILQQQVKYFEARLPEESKNVLLSSVIQQFLAELDVRMKRRTKCLDNELSSDIIELTKFIRGLYAEEMHRIKEADAEAKAKATEEKKDKEEETVILCMCICFVVCMCGVICIFWRK